MTTQFPQTGNYGQVTVEQVNLIKDEHPDYIVNGVFQGDDNDMAVLIGSIARKMRAAGVNLYACYMIDKMQGENFFTADWETYQKVYS